MMNGTKGSTMRRALWTVTVALAVGAAACLDDDITGTRPLAIELTATPTTVTAGESVQFNYDASGNAITLVVMDYGDGTVDSITYNGPVIAANQLSHTYTAPATYAVTASVTALQGTLDDNVVITVN